MSVTGTGAPVQDVASATGAGIYVSGGAFLDPTAANLPDFLTFLYFNVQISQAALPLSSPYPGYAFTAARGLVLCPGVAASILYVLAVYNCATHLLMTIAPDQPGQHYFTNMRSGKEGAALVNPSAGIVAASSDKTTSTALASPDWAKGLTVSQLGFFKTSWGREYLAYIQSYGPAIWGLT